MSIMMNRYEVQIEDVDDVYENARAPHIAAEMAIERYETTALRYPITGEGKKINVKVIDSNGAEYKFKVSGWMDRYYIAKPCE